MVCSGCYIIRPDAFYIWDTIKRFFDREIKVLSLSPPFSLLHTHRHAKHPHTHSLSLSFSVSRACRNWVSKTATSPCLSPRERLKGCARLHVCFLGVELTTGYVYMCFLRRKTMWRDLLRKWRGSPSMCAWLCLSALLRTRRSCGNTRSLCSFLFWDGLLVLEKMLWMRS